MFPCSTEVTWSSVPRSTHPPATRLCLSRSRPTHNNAPVYCKSTSSPDSEPHASKILTTVLLLSITNKQTKKNCKVNKCNGVRVLDIKLIEIAYCIGLSTLVWTTWWWPPRWPKHVVADSYLPSLAIDIWYFIYVPWIHNNNKQDIEHVKSNTCNRCSESKQNDSKSSTWWCLIQTGQNHCLNNKGTKRYGYS
jgi:hypothetical protein